MSQLLTKPADGSSCLLKLPLSLSAWAFLDLSAVHAHGGAADIAPLPADDLFVDSSYLCVVALFLNLYFTLLSMT